MRPTLRLHAKLHQHVQARRSHSWPSSPPGAPCVDPFSGRPCPYITLVSPCLRCLVCGVLPAVLTVVGCGAGGAFLVVARFTIRSPVDAADLVGMVVFPWLPWLSSHWEKASLGGGWKPLGIARELDERVQQRTIELDRAITVSANCQPGASVAGRGERRIARELHDNVARRVGRPDMNLSAGASRDRSACEDAGTLGRASWFGQMSTEVRGILIATPPTAGPGQSWSQHSL